MKSNNRTSLTIKQVKKGRIWRCLENWGHAVMGFSLEERLWMKQMQIYVSMPSFNIMESKDSDRTRAQLDACLCVYGCQRVHAFPNICVHVCVCAWEWGVHSQFLVMCVCLRLCLLFRDAAVLWSKGEAQREKGEKKGAKLLFSKDSCLLVRDTALIRRAVAVDKHDHRGGECKFLFQLTNGEMKTCTERGKEICTAVLKQKV